MASSPVTRSRAPIARPQPDEHIPYYARYIDLVPGDDALPALERQLGETLALVEGLDEARALYRYAPGKWSVKETLGHLVDCERIFTYRALRFARADETPVPGFDETIYVPGGRFDARPLTELMAEFRAVRAATVAFFGSLDADMLVRRGTANGSPISVRALAYIVAGHELHHRGILRERYGLGG